MKQTAVEWLEIQIRNTPTVENLMNQLYAFINEAKEMEKQHIIDAANLDKRHYDNAEQYYNETFNK